MDKRAVANQGGGTVSARQQLELTGAALLPAAAALLSSLAARAGRGAWLCPVLALPVGLWLCQSWRRAGRSYCQAAGPGGTLWSRLGAAAYLLWGVFLLGVSGASYAHRLSLSLGRAGTRPLVLGVTFLLALYLGRSVPAFARTSRIFFLTVAVTLGAMLALAIPSLRWENFLPVEAKGLAAGALEVVSLSGFAVYTLFLPREGQESVQPWAWCVWLCAGLGGLLLAVTGAFGPALAARMDEPFLYLASGVGIPGAFQRGEALLTVLAAMGDLSLLTLLNWACMRLWSGLFPGLRRGAWVPAGIGFLLAWLLPGAGDVGFWASEVAPVGNLIFGVAAPVLVAFAGGRPKEREKGTARA